MFNNLIHSWWFWGLFGSYTLFSIFTTYCWLKADERVQIRYSTSKLLTVPILSVLFPISFVNLMFTKEENYQIRERRIWTPLFGPYIWDKRYARQDQEVRRRKEERDRRINEWKAKNLPVLYYNTVEGVTAVVRARDWDDVLENTQSGRHDDWWHSERMAPYRRTCLFVIPKNNLPQELKGVIVGRPSDFFVGLSKRAILTEKNSLFVPGVSEAEMSFSEQGRRVHGLPSFVSLYQFLLEVDIPAEISA